MNCQAKRRRYLAQVNSMERASPLRVKILTAHQAVLPPNPTYHKPHSPAENRVNPESSIYIREEKRTTTCLNPTRGIIVKMHSLATNKSHYKLYQNTCQNSEWSIPSKFSPMAGEAECSSPTARPQTIGLLISWWPLTESWTRSCP